MPDIPQLSPFTVRDILPLLRKPLDVDLNFDPIPEEHLESLDSSHHGQHQGTTTTQDLLSLFREPEPESDSPPPRKPSNLNLDLSLERPRHSEDPMQDSVPDHLFENLDQEGSTTTRDLLSLFQAPEPDSPPPFKPMNLNLNLSLAPPGHPEDSVPDHLENLDQEGTTTTPGILSLLKDLVSDHLEKLKAAPHGRCLEDSVPEHLGSLYSSLHGDDQRTRDLLSLFRAPEPDSPPPPRKPSNLNLELSLAPPSRSEDTMPDSENLFPIPEKRRKVQCPIRNTLGVTQLLRPKAASPGSCSAVPAPSSEWMQAPNRPSEFPLVYFAMVPKTGAVQVIPGN